MSGTDRAPTIFDAIEAPPGHPCQQYHSRGDRDRPVECQNDADVVFVYEASLNPEDNRRKNCLGCEDCAPIPPRDVREVDHDV